MNSKVKATIKAIKGGMTPTEAARNANYGTAPTRGKVAYKGQGAGHPQRKNRQRGRSGSRNKVASKTLNIRKG